MINYLSEKFASYFKWLRKQAEALYHIILATVLIFAFLPSENKINSFNEIESLFFQSPYVSVELLMLFGEILLKAFITNTAAFLIVSFLKFIKLLNEENRLDYFINVSFVYLECILATLRCCYTGLPKRENAVPSFLMILIFVAGHIIIKFSFQVLCGMRTSMSTPKFKVGLIQNSKSSEPPIRSSKLPTTSFERPTTSSTVAVSTVGSNAPSVTSTEGSKTPVMGSGEGSKTPVMGSGEGSKAPVMGSGEGSNTPVMGSGEGSNTPVKGSGEGSNPPVMGSGEGSNTPVMGSGEGSNTPSTPPAKGSNTPSTPPTNAPFIAPMEGPLLTDRRQVVKKPSKTIAISPHEIRRFGDPFEPDWDVVESRTRSGTIFNAFKVPKSVRQSTDVPSTSGVLPGRPQSPRSLNLPTTSRKSSDIFKTPRSSKKSKR